ncbi:MAG: hypothetical protein KBA71_08970 [Opitutaceae bacterium]|nr:hypothetical protein [Opitutaceae bacterium]
MTASLRELHPIGRRIVDKNEATDFAALEVKNSSGLLATNLSDRLRGAFADHAGEWQLRSKMHRPVRPLEHFLDIDVKFHGNDGLLR